MGTIIRGIKNIFRNKSRNIAIILVLTLSLSLALMMVNMNFSSNQNVKSIKEKYGNSFSVTSSYDYYIIGKKEPYDEEKSLIDESIADEIAKIASVIEVNKYLSGDFISKKLKVPGITGIHKYMGEVEVISEEISNTISFLGTEESFLTEVAKGNTFKRNDIEQNVVVIADKFAERNKLDVGSNIIVKGEKLKIIGIYKVMGEFASELIFIPFKTTQRLFNLEGKVSFLDVTVDSIDNVQKTVDYINNKLSDGRIKAEHGREDDPFLLFFNNIKRISKVSMISSSMVAILIILSIMFINVRERAREIGILKAIGASNFNISTQFLVESISLCIIALILSTAITLATNQPLADFISEREKTEILEHTKGLDLTDEELAEIPEEIKELHGYNELEKLKSMKFKTTFFSQILIYAILLTFLLGIAGSLIPAYYISKLRPAEVLRFE